jgi:hypothetical protein
MSFKTEAAKVRSGLASGSFKKKSDPFKGFFDELSYGLKKQDEEKRQEERVKRQEARVAARATKAKQDAEDKLEREREKLASFYFTSTGQAPNPQNKSAIMSVIKGGNFTDFSDLEAHMKQYSTYSEGTVPSMEVAPGEVPFDMLPESDVDKQTQEILKQEKGAGTIEFGGSRGKDVLSMTLDEVRFELSDNSITSERRAELERRLASLTEAKDYIGTEMFHPDGRKSTPRNAEEEADLRSQGFVTIEPAAKKDFKDISFYGKDGATVVATDAEMAQQYQQSPEWSREKPGKPVPFIERKMYHPDGRSFEVKTAQDLTEALADGFVKIQPADKPDFVRQTLYLDGAEITPKNEAQEKIYSDKGYLPEKPANHGKGFQPRFVFDNSTGGKVKVFTQADLNERLDQGFTVEELPRPKDFGNVMLYNGRQSINVDNIDDLNKYLGLGFSKVNPGPEQKYIKRKYYKDGQEQDVLDQQKQDELEADGWSAIKLDDTAQIMADLGIDRKTAAQIENGVLKVSTNFAGQPIVIDISQGTSEQVSSENSTEQQNNLDSLDAALSQVNPNWKDTLRLEIVVDGKTVVVTPEQIQNNESFKIQVEDLTGLEGAFGLGGALNKLAGKAGDIFGVEFQSEQNKAITFMSNLRLNTLINLAAATAGGLRDSVWNKQQIIATLPEPARVFEGPIEARNKTVETLRSIKTSLKLLDRNINSGQIAKAQLSQSTITRASLKELEKTYLTVLEAFEGSVEPVALPNSFISTPNKTSGETD